MTKPDKLEPDEDYKARIRELRKESEQIDKELDQFLVPPKLPDLSRFMKALAAIEGNVGDLHGTVTKAAELADSISVKVRKLDLDQSRIKEALKQVEDASVLRACVDGVEKCMRNSEFEQAAEWINKFYSFDSEQTQLLFGQYLLMFEKESKLDLDQAKSIMEKSRSMLLEICLVEFVKHAKNSEEDEAMKYLKIFDTIGEKEKALQNFVSYIVQEIRKSNDIPLNIGERGGITFIFAITRLFEYIAALLDSKEKLVNEIFGPGAILYIIRGIEEETIFQSLKIIEVFFEKRYITRKSLEIQNNSLELRGDEKLDLKEVSLILDEMSAICQKIHIFERFATIRAQEALSVIVSEEHINNFYQKLKDASKYSPVTGLLKNSELSARLKEMMNMNFIQLESHFLVHSVRKALRIDSYRSDSDELTSSSVEDVFYILKKVTARALSSQDIDTICVTLNMISRTIEDDYLREGLYKRMTSGFGGEKAFMLSERPESKVGYMILINNLDQSRTYITKLCQDVEAQVGKLFSLPLFGDSEKNEKIKSCLTPVQESVGIFQRYIKVGLENIYHQTFKSRYKQVTTDTLGSLSFSMSEEEYQEYENLGGTFTNTESFGSISYGSSKDDFVRKFTVGLKRLLDDKYEKYLTEHNFSLFLSMCMEAFSKDWEHVILTSNLRINQYAAMKMDKDFRNVTTYLNNLLPMGSCRDIFFRLNNIIALLNLENIHEFGDLDISRWKLSSGEIRKVLSLRFGTDEVSRIKLI